MKNFCLSLILMVGGGNLVAQVASDSCTNNRFRPGLNVFAFNNVDVLPITYGTTAANVGRVYSPTGDLTNCRPAVIWAHGGGFFTGSYLEQKTTDMMRQLARKGYVAIAIAYRLWPSQPANTQQFQEALIRGVQDMKAAVRFVKANANTLRIDTSQVFVGGSSAGAIIANHTTYMSANEAFTLALANQGGNLNVTTPVANLSVSDKVAGCVTQAGAIWNLSFLDGETTPWGAVHNTTDATVPHNTGGGSLQIFNRLQSIGTKSFLHLTNSPNLHTPFPGTPVAAYVDTFNLQSYRQLYAMLKHNGQASVTVSGNRLTAQPSGISYQWYLNNIPISGATAQTYTPTANGKYKVRVQNCNNCFSTSPEVDNVTTNVSESSFDIFNIFPNPTSGTLKIQLFGSEVIEITFFNAVGEAVFTQVMKEREQEIDLSDKPKGVYHYRLIGSQVRRSGTIVIY
ncbi:MAG: alpha/beta hydrolase fold domain-containing protein [Bacteroidota bacterium]|jgi:alpha/beta superfamily hydrolase|nr:alpha/beta hydrolase fold domain-containing protein [Cytophagales bacterium]MCE2955603.1 alpha/beta hydrolase fold domain-containing protein [Flammeovirgaceae bacterium]MCZ8071985.1 alpha/beta hydrolase fold domain-containing protein [Cytophagales bacterium]